MAAAEDSMDVDGGWEVFRAPGHGVEFSGRTPPSAHLGGAELEGDSQEGGLADSSGSLSALSAADDSDLTSSLAGSRVWFANGRRVHSTPPFSQRGAGGGAKAPRAAGHGVEFSGRQRQGTHAGGAEPEGDSQGDLADSLATSGDSLWGLSVMDDSDLTSSSLSSSRVWFANGRRVHSTPPFSRRGGAAASEEPAAEFEALSPVWSRSPESDGGWGAARLGLSPQERLSASEIGWSRARRGLSPRERLFEIIQSNAGEMDWSGRSRVGGGSFLAAAVLREDASLLSEGGEEGQVLANVNTQLSMQIQLLQRAEEDRASEEGVEDDRMQGLRASLARLSSALENTRETIAKIREEQDDEDLSQNYTLPSSPAESAVTPSSPAARSFCGSGERKSGDRDLMQRVAEIRRELLEEKRLRECVSQQICCLVQGRT